MHGRFGPEHWGAGCRPRPRPTGSFPRPRQSRRRRQASSVAVRNALRTGLGLALAVAVTHLFPVEHGFWVVLGALSVLRSSALTTGTKMLRAVLGTGIGFVLGALLISVVGV